MIIGSNLAIELEPEQVIAVSAQVLRRWCTPSLMLAITDLADEEKLLFNLIRQAMPGSAKVLLAHVLRNADAQHRSRNKRVPAENGGSAKTARVALEQMARQLRWVGVSCDPILRATLPVAEVPAIVAARGIDRILLTSQSDEHGCLLQHELAEELLAGAAVPVCVLGPRMASAPRSEAAAGRILLALSLHSDCRLQLAFASRLAQEQRAKLTLLHVSDPADEAPVRTPAAVASCLPASALREAELLCPVEIAVREGDPATEILEQANSARHDYLVLGPSGPQPARLSGRATVARNVVSGARCPVMLLGDSISAEQPKPPQSVYP